VNLTPGESINVERASSASATYTIRGFYPLGHVVALQSSDDAERMRQHFLDGGYDEREVILANSAQGGKGARAPAIGQRDRKNFRRRARCDAQAHRARRRRIDILSGLQPFRP
jgi:hypothetical protein